MTLWRAHAGAGSWQDLLSHGKWSHAEADLLAGFVTPWKAATVEQPVSEELQPVSLSVIDPYWSCS